MRTVTALLACPAFGLAALAAGAALPPVAAPPLATSPVVTPPVVAQQTSAPQAGAPQPAAIPTQAPPPAESLDATTRLRAIARMLVNVEARHRAQVWELERIAAVAEKERRDDVLRSAIRTRHLAEEDYAARLAGFQRDLGAELYGRMRAALDAGPGKPPPWRAILPEPPPPPPPLPHEEAEQNAQKREREEAEGGG